MSIAAMEIEEEGDSVFIRIDQEANKAWNRTRELFEKTNCSCKEMRAGGIVWPFTTISSPGNTPNCILLNAKDFVSRTCATFETISTEEMIKKQPKEFIEITTRKFRLSFRILCHLICEHQQEEVETKELIEELISNIVDFALNRFGLLSIYEVQSVSRIQSILSMHSVSLVDTNNQEEVEENDEKIDNYNCCEED